MLQLCLWFHEPHSGPALGSHWQLSQGHLHCNCSRTCWSAVAWSNLAWDVAVSPRLWPLVAIGVTVADWKWVIESRPTVAEEWSQAAYKPELYVKTCHNLMPGNCYGGCVHVAGLPGRIAYSMVCRDTVPNLHESITSREPAVSCSSREGEIWVQHCPTQWFFMIFQVTPCLQDPGTFRKGVRTRWSQAQHGSILRSTSLVLESLPLHVRTLLRLEQVRL